jgi:class 3 adenylate cyclase/predicted ATPase
MFCDLVGSTELACHLDPEEMGEVLRTYQNAVAREVARLDGHVGKLMGDGVLAYFGWPKVHEDEAERAVRAGLAITATVARLGMPGGRPLACRVGIATGLVVVGDLVGEGSAQEEAVVGDTPNLAARLQLIAEPGSVVVAETTRRLLGGLFQSTSLGPQAIKGFANPIRAFRIEGETTVEGRFEAFRDARSAPLVGRAQELALLLERWRQALAGEGQVVLLSGEPGIGKSRLIEALRDATRSEWRTSLRYHGSPHHANDALWPVVQHLVRAAGLAREDSLETKLDKLEALIAQSVGDPSELAPHLASLLDLDPRARYSARDLTPQQRKAQTFQSLFAQLDGLARQGPVLILAEDVHWFDPTTIELFEAVVERTRQLPALLVVTFRPQRPPPWTGYPHATLLTLNRLSRADTTSLIHRIAGGRILPEAVLDAILERTEGIPIFAEELTKSIIESGLLREEQSGFELVNPLPEIAIPNTLHDSLMARLDRLGPVRELAQVAACIGREFSCQLLSAATSLPESSLFASLDRLVASELVFRHGLAPAATYSFKHALVRDAAYGSLLKERRRQIHGRIARAIEEQLPEIAAGQPGVLAHHLTEAGLVQRASQAWTRAGLAALHRSAMIEATSALQNAARLLRELPETDERKRCELDLLLSLGVALMNSRGPAAAETEATYERASTLARELGDDQRWRRARWSLWRVTNVRAQYNEAAAIAEGLLEHATREKSMQWTVHAHHAAWSTRLFMGDFDVMRQHADQGLALYNVERDAADCVALGGHDARECGLIQAGNAELIMGRPDRARAMNRAGIEHGFALGIPQAIAHSHSWSLILLQLISDTHELEARTTFLAEFAEKHGMNIYHSEARIWKAWLGVTLERDRRAFIAMRECVDRRLAMGTLFLQTYFFWLIGEAALSLGLTEEALAAAREGLARASTTGEFLCFAELNRLMARCRLAIDVGDEACAESDLRAALADARARSARLWELRAGMDLARLRMECGRREEARELLLPIYDRFTEGSDTPDLGAAKALLDELRN